MAAEIAAANEKSTMRPVGNFLVPGHAKKSGELRGKVDRKKLSRRSGDYVESREGTESESEEEEGGGEEWLGEDEGFVSTSSENFSFFSTPVFESEDTFEE